jgi:hypothetical protein
MFGRGICEKYQSKDEKFSEPNGEGNLVSRLVFFASTPPKHDKNKEIDNLEKELEQIYEQKAKGVQIRSREKWVEFGEKNNA